MASITCTHCNAVLKTKDPIPPGKKGKVTPIAETIRSFEELCDGKHDNLREDAFMYVGGIDEAVEQAKRLEAEGK